MPGVHATQQCQHNRAGLVSSQTQLTAYWHSTRQRGQARSPLSYLQHEGIHLCSPARLLQQRQQQQRRAAGGRHRSEHSVGRHCHCRCWPCWPPCCSAVRRRHMQGRPGTAKPDAVVVSPAAEAQQLPPLLLLLLLLTGQQQQGKRCAILAGSCRHCWQLCRAELHGGARCHAPLSAFASAVAAAAGDDGSRGAAAAGAARHQQPPPAAVGA